MSEAKRTILPPAGPEEMANSARVFDPATGRRLKGAAAMVEIGIAGHRTYGRTGRSTMRSNHLRRRAAHEEGKQAI